jgi:hypothetical protein
MSAHFNGPVTTARGDGGIRHAKPASRAHAARQIFAKRSDIVSFIAYLNRAN